MNISNPSRPAPRCPDRGFYGGSSAGYRWIDASVITGQTGLSLSFSFPFVRSNNDLAIFSLPLVRSEIFLPFEQILLRITEGNARARATNWIVSIDEERWRGMMAGN